MTTLIRESTAVFPAARGPISRLVRRIGRMDLALIGIIAVGATVLVMTNILGAPAYQDDEGVYAAEAASVQNGDLAPYTYWYDHPPFGWIQLAILGGLTRVFGLGAGTDIGAMRFVIALYFVANAVLIYLLGRRLRLAPLLALAASAAFVFSPLSLASGRQVYLDCVAMPWLLLAFFLALSPRRALWSHAAAGGAFAVAVLSKLTAAIAGPALMVALLDRRGWRGRSFSLVAFLAVGTLLLSFFPLVALLRGELLSGAGHVSLQDGLLYQFASREGSGFLWQPGSGRFQLVASWIATDSFLLVAGIVGAIICLFARRTRWITVAVVSVFIPVTIGQGYLPAMYIIGVVPFLCLAIGASADLVWRATTALARRSAPSALRPIRLVTAAVLAVALVAIPTATWADDDAALLTADTNREWNATLDWVAANVPHDDVVVVPYSMWQDLNESGWHDPWSMIVLEKVDLDSAYLEHHPGGWREIEWVVEGPTVEPNLRYLGLDQAAIAYENSTVVKSFGPWNVRRVEVAG